jgi:hypothetical protein
MEISALRAIAKQMHESGVGDVAICAALVSVLPKMTPGQQQYIAPRRHKMRLEVNNGEVSLH